MSTTVQVVWCSKMPISELKLTTIADAYVFHLGHYYLWINISAGNCKVASRCLTIPWYKYTLYGPKEFNQLHNQVVLSKDWVILG